MADRACAVLAKKKGRSRLSNGHALPRGVHSHSSWARRFRDLLAIQLSERPDASESEVAIVKRACTLIVSLEQMELRFAIAGKASNDDLEVYQRCSSSMRRLLESVGLQRRQKQVGMTLGELLRQDHEEQVRQQREARHA